MHAAEIFNDGGALARVLPRYAPRQAQKEMAEEVAAAMAAGGAAVLEAPPGVGKTFAYLVPIILAAAADDAHGKHRRPAIISTGTRALQTQLYARDIPLLSRALQVPVHAAVLKGRANYLCRHRFSQAQKSVEIAVDGGRLSRAQKNAAGALADYAEPLRHFAARTPDGDISAVDGVPLRAAVWEHATSTPENCLAQKCKYYDEECYVYMARAEAQHTDIVIVNHHLFLSDLRLREEGVARILPKCGALVFDEAHLLPEIAVDIFGSRFSFKQLMRRAEEAENFAAEKGGDAGGASLAAAAAALRESARQSSDAVLSLAEGGNGAGRLSRNDAARDGDCLKAIEDCAEKLDAYRAECEKAAPHAPQLEKYWNRACQDAATMRAWCAEGEEGGAEEDGAAREESDITVRWLERHKDAALLCQSPLSARRIFSQSVLEEGRACIFTSATLTAGGGNAKNKNGNDSDNNADDKSGFDYFCNEMGLEGARQTAWASPYDIAGRTKMYIPQKMPDVRGADFAAAVAEESLALAAANEGRAFVLCTSFAVMAVVAKKLREDMPKHIPVLAQKDAPNEELLRRFQRRPSVLVGSAAFWQGVDIPGDALSLVIVDKLPFRVPTDPVLRAREAWCKQRGIDAFVRDQVPHAAMRLKQAAGRLLRDSTDYGVFAVLDLRLINRGYGAKILRSLPPMSLTRNAQEAVDFLKKMRAAAGAK